MSNNDPEIAKLQETHANLRIALGAGASTLNELKADITVHESTLNSIAKEIDNSELPEDDPTSSPSPQTTSKSKDTTPPL